MYSGISPDLETWDQGLFREGIDLLDEDPVFEPLAMNEYTIAHTPYLYGRSRVLATMYSHVRAKGDPALQLSDPVSVAVAHYALVDYERDNGAFAALTSDKIRRTTPSNGCIGWEL
ncbi:MAG: hypothetical protein P8L31_11210 [Pseudomonadales bacterium]|nr:hypothetical protein [Pseudomonadales bacterium]